MCIPPLPDGRGSVRPAANTALAAQNRDREGAGAELLTPPDGRGSVSRRERFECSATIVMYMLFWLMLLAVCPQADEPVPTRRDVVVVTGVYEPVPLEEADRAVRALPVGAEQRLLAASAADFLRLDPSLDLRSRAPNGVQSDLSIRGGSFGQTLVLLDGLRLNDAQSGHHNLDIPVPLDALARIELLKGTGSAYYGSDAVGGVVNLITREPEAAEFRLRASAGNFGSNAQSGAAGLVWRSVSQQFSFSRDFSSGFAPDRDYRNLSLASITQRALASRRNPRPSRAQRPAVRRRSVLRQLQFLGAHPNVVRGGAAGTRRRARRFPPRTAATRTCSCSTATGPRSTRTATRWKADRRPCAAASRWVETTP